MKIITLNMIDIIIFTLLSMLQLICEHQVLSAFRFPTHIDGESQLWEWGSPMVYILSERQYHNLKVFLSSCCLERIVCKLNNTNPFIWEPDSPHFQPPLIIEGEYFHLYGGENMIHIIIFTLLYVSLLLI